MASVAQSGAKLQSIALGPLQHADLSRMAADALGTEAAQTHPLVDILLAKTGGNPFFVIHFLKTLHQDGLIFFDARESRFKCRLDAIEGAAMTDNVVDLMSRKINRLAEPARRTLTLAACIGNRFDLATLATVSERSSEAAWEALAPAVAEGLIVPEGDDVFAFLHDRVQQAAYAQIPAAQKPQAHLTIGRLLAKKPPGEREHVFDIASHLNIGRALLTDAGEQVALARLNLAAGQKAKQSTAYQTALGYFSAGSNICGEANWDSDYELVFKLHLCAAECEYLCGELDEAEAHLDTLLARGRTKLDLAEVYKLKVLKYESSSRYLDAIRIGREALNLFGLSFPEVEADMQAALEVELSNIHALLAGRAIASLVDLPVMQDPEKRMLMKLLSYLPTSCYLSANKYLTLLNTSAMVKLSLHHGNVEESAYGYVLHAMNVGPIRGDYESAYEFGMLAIRLADRFNDPGPRARVRMNFAWNVSLWRQPIAASLPVSRETFQLANESGLFVEAAYTLFNDCYFTLLSAPELDSLKRHCAPNVEYIKRNKMQHFAVGAPQVILQWGLALQGLTERPTSLTDANFSEVHFQRDYRDESLFEMFYFVAKLALLYTFGEYRAARVVALEAERVIKDYTGTIWDELTVFYHALVLAALYDELTAQERLAAAERLQTFAARLQKWADNAPRNYRHQYLMVCAEIAKHRGEDGQAIALYEQAVATPADCPRETALANELFARFWLRRGNRKIAASYFRDSREHYAAWGAHAKERDLVRRHGDLIGGRTNSVEAREPNTLDAATIVKAAHAITEKIDLDDFMQQMLRIAIENAGAHKGLLIEEREDGLHVAAQGRVGAEQFEPPQALTIGEAPFSSAIVNYVARTKTNVVLADAAGDERFLADPYIAGVRPKSILCMPIVHQGELSAILYLENNLTCGVFTSQRIHVIQVLSAQAAISLKNARLFDGMRQEIARRLQAEAGLRSALTEVETLKNELEAENIYLRRDLIANVSHDLRTPLASLRGYVDTLLIKDDSLNFDKRRSYLEIVAKQSERLSHLVEQLFELAKLDFKGFEIDREPLKLDELGGDVLQKFELGAEQQEIALRFEAPDDVPFVHADIGLIERALENLIDNALKHSRAGGAVTLAIGCEQNQVRTKVTDSGDGIPEKDLPHIFDRFYRGDKSRGTAGAGLGLAITKRIVELHGSRISVASSAESGTCFSFALEVANPLAVR